MKRSGNYLKAREVAIELHKRRVEERSKKNKNLFLNNAEIQVIGANSQGFSPVLLVNSEGCTYMFNCHEGVQRFCYSNKVKLTGLENVFVTNLEWRRISGLFGLSLTLQDLGAVQLGITSGEGIRDIFNVTKSFMAFTTGMRCFTRTNRTGTYSNRGIQVAPIALDDSALAATNNLNEQGPSAKKSKKTVKLLAYVCELPDLPGPLDPNKCRELKVPIGPLLGVLKSGKDVTLPDGRIISSSEVCGNKNKGAQFIVIECPTTDDISKLFANGELESLRKARVPDADREISLVAHFSPPDVMRDQEYIRWMNGFPDSCKHLSLLEPDSKTQVSFVDSFRLQYLLRKLDDVIFPELDLVGDFLERSKTERSAINLEADRSSLVGSVNDEEDDKIVAYHCKGTLKDHDKVLKPASMDKIVMRPHDRVEGLEGKISLDLLYSEAALNPEFDERLADLRELQGKLPKAKDFEPEVVFLGTGSALPSKMRNTSCILLNFTHPKAHSVMMDCGEDSYGQLVRRFGNSRTDEILKQLRVIYVSHQHADHHIGLLTLLIERYKLTKEPLALLVPPGLEPLLNYYNENFNDISESYNLYSTKTLKLNPKLIDQESTWTLATQFARKKLFEQLDDILADVKIVDVDHCVNSCAVVFHFKIEHQDMKTFSVAYSGDARPSEDFSFIGRDCDLLIHEATFDQKSLKDAVTKKHCTCDEAIEVSRKMRAKFTVLTHFSQRLSKIPYFTDKFDDKIGFAFDNLSLRCPSHFGRLPIMKDMLKLVFEKALRDVDMKNYKLEAKAKGVEQMLRLSRDDGQ